MEHFGTFKNLRGRISSFHEVDGVFGELMGLIDVFFKDDIVLASFEEDLHILLI